jgi:hypothetical protein
MTELLTQEDHRERSAHTTWFLDLGRIVDRERKMWAMPTMKFVTASSKRKLRSWFDARDATASCVISSPGGACG